MEMLQIAGKTFESRLFVGTGKFASSDLMEAAVLASQSRMVTVALKRVEIGRVEEDDMISRIVRHPEITLCPILRVSALPKKPFWRLSLHGKPSKPTGSSWKYIRIPAICSLTLSRRFVPRRSWFVVALSCSLTFRPILCCASIWKKPVQPR